MQKKGKRINDIIRNFEFENLNTNQILKIKFF